MNDWPLLFVAAELAILLLVLIGVVLLLRRMRARLREDAHDAAPDPVVTLSEPRRAPSPEGGWKDLAANWGTDLPAKAEIARGVSLSIGAVRWRNCVVVGRGERGLHLSVRIPLLGSLGRRPLDIPWFEITDVGPATLYFMEARVLEVGHPPIARLVLPSAIVAEIVEHRRLHA